MNEQFQSNEMVDLKVSVVGMVFGSPDEAYDVYKKYSCKVVLGSLIEPDTISMILSMMLHFLVIRIVA